MSIAQSSRQGPGLLSLLMQCRALTLLLQELCLDHGCDDAVDVVFVAKQAVLSGCTLRMTGLAKFLVDLAEARNEALRVALFEGFAVGHTLQQLMIPKCGL